MRALLDTHVFLWALDDPAKLPQKLVSLFHDPDVELFLSAASAWEIAVKYELGKLDLPAPPPEYVRTRCAALGIEPLPITLEHAGSVASLPGHHRDPFDRMLVVQAAMEGLTLATVDPVFSRYRVRRLGLGRAPAGTPTGRRKTR